ncbi:UNVERIFIED_CONTAM: hypothetical protein GTU68_000335 [Idotea baltica]|nr:hypothetical protein [Idotea baltica]
MKNKIGIIGGSGLYNLESLEKVENIKITTPFGAPSSEIVSGEINGIKVYFLARHGFKHNILPSEVNYKANIYALKSLGVNFCLSISACGSLREEIKPGDFVIPDQIIDFTKNREKTFFGNGVVAHIPFAEPFSNKIREVLINELISNDISLHKEATYLCIEGPNFSSKAESRMFRGFGADIIGMTNSPEAHLAREASISYATLALVSDYDSWQEDAKPLDTADLIAILNSSTTKVKEKLALIIEKINQLDQEKSIKNVLDFSLLTQKEDFPKEVKEKLETILK